MSQDALRGLRALLSLLNQPQVNSEIERLFRSSRNSSPSSASSATSTNTATNTATTNTITNTVNTALTNVGPLFSPRTAATRGRGRGRGRGRATPYTAPGHFYTRIIVLLSGPNDEDVPRGRQRQLLRNGHRETRVSFRSGMTPSEVRTSILHAFQAQGHMRNIT